MKQISILLLLVTSAFAQTHNRLAEYALVLEDPPVAQKVQSRVALQSAAAQAHLQRVRGAQSRVLAELATRKVRVSSTSQTLVNAIFVRVAPEQAAALIKLLDSSRQFRGSSFALPLQRSSGGELFSIRSLRREVNQ